MPLMLYQNFNDIFQVAKIQHTPSFFRAKCNFSLKLLSMNACCLCEFTRAPSNRLLSDTDIDKLVIDQLRGCGGWPMDQHSGKHIPKSP